jgi:hypothetical protein
MDDFEEFLSEMEDRGTSRIWRWHRKVGTPYVKDRCPFVLMDNPAQMTNRSEDEKRCDECGLMFAGCNCGWNALKITDCVVACTISERHRRPRFASIG